MKALLLTVLLLSGCASVQKPDVVQVPITVPCETKAPNKPTLRYSPPYDSLFEGVRDLLGDRELMTGYDTELQAALKSCQ